jgi:hypothetical protein
LGTVSSSGCITRLDRERATPSICDNPVPTVDHIDKQATVGNFLIVASAVLYYSAAMSNSSTGPSDPSKTVQQLVDEFTVVDQEARAIQAQMVTLTEALAIRSREMKQPGSAGADPAGD